MKPTTRTDQQGTQEGIAMAEPSGSLPLSGSFPGRLAVISRGSEKPLYYQLAESVERAIEDGDLAPDQRLPAEIRLASDLKITQSTVRRAWTYLENKGLVRREAGTGTFVL
jgi:DNA-binding transcriptional ArsR family regulator